MKNAPAHPLASFTIIELLVVIGILLALASLFFPAYLAQREGARINEARQQRGIFEAALAQYRRQFGDYPPSRPQAAGDNAGIETMLASLRTHEHGGPFIQESIIARWLTDTDGDGRQELADPWRNPWIYFHPSDYTAGAVYYRLNGTRMEISPVKKGDAFMNLTSYQLWACGPNKINESGQGDDTGNVE